MESTLRRRCEVTVKRRRSVKPYKLKRVRPEDRRNKLPRFTVTD